LSNPIIKVENVGIRFNIASEKTDSLKEYIIKLVKRELYFKEFWALQDINFEMERGEALAIIGANGSGKSTLLKLICRILDPDTGSITVNGSIAPLIELGAGLDGELTAEENIVLGGALLGHSKKFMLERRNEIVAFAELGEFMQMPLKNYSSGMYARLAFALSTLVKPDILIVDEVLAVGDIAFQKKCEKRMKEMLAGGTTLLYVSHDDTSVRNLCKKALWLKKGGMVMMGDAEEVCAAYEVSMSNA
jgi:ABC-type polysaccharide/polyol phosphate transport system ATPase subunit